MSPCEDSLKGAVNAETLTGPSLSKVICRIGNRGDIKQYVWVKNRRRYPSPISVEVNIISNPRYIHFEADPDCPDVMVGRTSWQGTCELASKEEYVFCVSVISDDPNKRPQQIEINIISETTTSPSYSPPMKITVLA